MSASDVILRLLVIALCFCGAGFFAGMEAGCRHGEKERGIPDPEPNSSHRDRPQQSCNSAISQIPSKREMVERPLFAALYQ